MKTPAISISKLNSMAFRLAVYASWCGSPRHHARLAYDCSAQLYHVGLSPTGLLQRFSAFKSLSIASHLYRLAWRKEGMIEEALAVCDPFII
jgi:hypothetical protein